MKYTRILGLSSRASRHRRFRKTIRRTLQLFAPGSLIDQLENRTLLAGGLTQSSPVSAEIASAQPSGSPKTLDDLDPLARHAISASMGADQAAYAAVQTDTGYSFTNRYNVSMTTAGATFQSGTDTWHFMPESFGYGADQVPIGDSQISAGKNRVTYDAANLDTWFVNGPAGVQQGFTLDHRPGQGDPSQPLVVQVGLGGSLSASVQAGGRGLSLARPDGTSVMNFGGLVAYDATGKSFDARMELVPDGAGHDLHFVVEDTGAVYPLTIDPVTTITETAILSQTDPTNNSLFASCVATSADGSIMFVSNTSASIDGASGAGAVYVYVRPAGGWATTSTYSAKLTIDSSSGIKNLFEAQFGSSISLSADGNTVLIGSSPSNLFERQIKYAFLFTKPAGGWQSTSTFTAKFDSMTESDNLLSADGSTILTTNYYEDNAKGAGYIYVKPAGGWVSKTFSQATAKLTVSTAQMSDCLGMYGAGLSGDGSLVVISGGNSRTGCLYSRPVSGWVSTGTPSAIIDSFQVNTVTPGTPTLKISSDGSTLVSYRKRNGSYPSGSVPARIYSRPANGTWVSTDSPTAILSSEEAWLWDISLSSDGSKIAAVEVRGSNFKGKVNIYSRPAGGWANSTVPELIAEPAAPPSGYYYQFGRSIALTADQKSLFVGVKDTTNSYEGFVYNYTLNAPATLTASPSNAGVAVGGTGTFTARASGAPAPRVQWQQSTDSGGTWTDIAGATNYTYTTPATVAGDDGKQFRAVFTNSYSGTTFTATSTAATMTVGYVPVVTSQPSTVSLNAGSTATYTAAASGTPSPTVQWYKSTDYMTAATPTWSPIGGANSLSYTTPASVKADNNSYYRARFTNAIGTADTTPAKLIVLFPPEIVTQPTSAQVTGGTTASFTAAANGGPTPTVQWQLSNDSGTSWSNITGANNLTYSFTAMGPDQGNMYRAIFTNSQGSATTDAATLTVLPGFLSPSNTTFLPGLNNNFPVSFTSAGNATISTNYDYWNTSFPSLPKGWMLSGNASITGNAAVLTTATNSQQGKLVLPAIGVKTPTAFQANFRYRTSDSTNGADGTSFNYGLISANASGSETGILANNTGLVVSIIEWNGNRIEARYNGTLLANVPYTLGNNYRNYNVTVNGANQLLLNVDGSTIISVGLPSDYATANKTAWQYGFGARTGGRNSQHSVMNLTISTPALPPGLNFNSTTNILSGSPGIGTSGSYTIALVATDSVGSTIQPFTVNVPLSTVMPGQRNGSIAGFVGSTGQQVNNDGAFAVLDTVGKIITFGNATSGANLPSCLTSNNGANNTGYVEIVSNRGAFAALRKDGSIVSWDSYGSVANSPTATGFTTISSTATAFAALQANGSITAWGDTNNGGQLPNQLSGSNSANNTGFIKIFSNNYAFVAMKADGTLVSWGRSEVGGASSGSSLAPANNLTNPFVQVYSNSRNDAVEGSFAALRADGSIVSWGFTPSGSFGVPSGTGYVTIVSTKDAYAALKNDGTIAVWGGTGTGGTGGPSSALNTGYMAVYATQGAFVGVRSDGSLYGWGHTNDGGTGAPSGTGFVSVASTLGAFAAINGNGTISVWGNTGLGGSLPSCLTSNGGANNTGFVRLFSNPYGFVGMKANGSTVTWGDSSVTANAPAANVTGFTQVLSNARAFFGANLTGYRSWGETASGGSKANTTALLTVQTGTVGVPYYSNLTIYPTGFVSGLPATFDFSAGGIGVYYSVTSGNLPANMSLNPLTGVVSGTPLANYTGPANFTIRASSPVGSVSKQFLMTAQYAPVISTQPVDSLVNPGANATFTVAASANPAATVQWYTRGNSIYGSWALIQSNATGTTYIKANVTAAENDSEYKAVFTNDVGTTESNVAKLVVLSAPAVVTNPANTTGVVGSSATFSTYATGNPAPSIQWQKSPDGSTGWANLTGQVSDTLNLPTLTAFDNNTWYRAIFTNVSGSNTTTAGRLTVYGVPIIAGQPSDLTVSNGNIGSFSSYSSANPPADVVWQTSLNGVNTWTNVAGATFNTYSFTANLSDTGRYYRAVFTNTVGQTSTIPVLLTVTAPPAPPSMTTQPANQTSQAGNTNTFNAIAVGSPTPTVQWQQSTNGTTWTNVTGGSGATTTIFTTPTLASSDNGLQYRALFTNSGGSVASNAVTLSLVSSPTITTQPTSQIGNAGTTVSFVAAATASPSPTVQWEQSTDGGTSWTAIAGATSTTYVTATLTGSDNGKMVRAVFTNGNGADAVSNSANLTVNYVSTEPVTQSVLNGQTATFSAVANSTTTPVTQRWQLSTNNGTSWTDISGATSSSYTTNAVGFSDDGNLYRAVFTNSLGNFTTANALLVVQTTFTEVTNTNDSGVGSLRAAINYAANATGPDTVTFRAGLAGSTILLTTPIVINDTSGNLTIQGLSGANRVSVSGGGATGLLSVYSATTVSNLTFTAANGSGLVAGGAIYSNSSLQLDNVRVNNSTGSAGAGLYQNGGFANLNNAIMGNAVYLTGGGCLTFTGGTMERPLTVASGNLVTVREHGAALTLGQIVANGLTVQVTSNAIDQAAGTNIIVSGEANFVSGGNGSDGNVTLMNATNDFYSTGTLAAGGTNISIVNSNGTRMGWVRATTLTVNSTGGAITQNGTNTNMIVTGLANFISATSVSLTNSTNSFGCLSLPSPQTNINIITNMTLPQMQVSNLTITGNGTVTQTPGTSLQLTGTSNFSVTGNVLLNNSSNQFNGPIIISANYATVCGTGNINLANVSANDLSVSTRGGGSIRQNGRVSVRKANTTYLTAIGGSIILNNLTNDFVGGIHALATYDIELYNSNATILGNISSQNFQMVSAGGGITQVAGTNVAVSGLANLVATGNAITLTQPTNDFATLQADGSVLTVNETTSVSLGTISVVGGVTINGNSSTSCITVTSPITATGSAGVLLLGRNIEVLADITTNSGTIELYGNGGGSFQAGTFDGVSILGPGVNITSSSVNIVMDGRAGGGSNFTGIMLSQTLVQTGGSGTISLTGVSGNGSTALATGVYADTSTLTTANGAMTIVGSSCGTDADNTGVFINFSSVTITGGGNLTITGTANGTDGAIGILVGDSAISTTNGTVTQTGTSYGTGADTSGIFYYSNSSLVSSGSVAGLSLTGSTPGNTATGLSMSFATGSNLSTSGAPITLTANSLNINATIGFVNATTSGTVTIRTLGAGVDLGGADSGSNLGLTSGEISRITAGVLVIGSSTTGPIVNSDSVVRSNTTLGTNLTLVSGNAISQSGSGNLAIAGTANFVSTGTGTAGNITLANATNYFALANQVIISGTNVTFVSGNSTGISVGRFTATGNLTVNSTAGPITQAGGANVTVAGTAQFIAGGSGTSGNITISNLTNSFSRFAANGTNITVAKTGGINFGAVLATGCLTANGGSGPITQAAGTNVNVTGTANFVSTGTGTSGNITLLNLNNKFGRFDARGTNISVSDPPSGIVLGNVVATGDFFANGVTGPITQAAGTNVVVAGTANFITAGFGTDGNITLDRSTNNFNIVLACGTNITIIDSGNITTYNITGSYVNLTSGGALSVTGPGVIAAGNIVLTASNQVDTGGYGLDNRNSNGSISITSTYGGFNQSGGTIQSNGPITISTLGNISTGVGGIQAPNSNQPITLSSSAGSITTDGGGIQSKGNLTIQANGSLLIQGGGINLSSGPGDVNISSANSSVSITSGTLRTGGNINITAKGNISTGLSTGGFSATPGNGIINVTSTAGAIDLSGGGIQGKRDITVTASNAISIAAGGINTTSGSGNVSVTSINNHIAIPSGGIFAIGQVTLSAPTYIEALGTVQSTSCIIATTNNLGISSSFTATPTGTITIRTLGSGINLGGTDNLSNLGLSQTELNYISAGTLIIGNASTGAIVNTAPIDRSNATLGTNLTLISGNSITQSGGNLTIGGTANFVSGGSGVNGNITLGNATNNFNILTVSGTNLTLAESNNITLNNTSISRTVNITAANVVTITGSYSAANTIVSNGTLVAGGLMMTNLTINNAAANIQSGGNITGAAVVNNGSLTSNGAFGSLTINNGGTLYTTSTGTTTGALTFANGSVWNASGANKNDFSQITAGGAVTIGATANLTLTAPGPANLLYGEGLTLINKVSGGAISQASGFANLPQGTFFSSNNTSLMINYNAQVGNYTDASTGNSLIVRIANRIIYVVTQNLTTTANSAFGNLIFRSLGGSANGTPIANVPYTITLPANVNNSNTASGRFDNANTSNRSITLYTDSNGNISVPIWANNNPGPFQVNITQADDPSQFSYPYMGVIGVAVQQQSINRSYIRYMDVVLSNANLTTLNYSTANFLANFMLTRVKSASFSGGANIVDSTNYLANGPAVPTIYTTPVGYKIDFGMNGLGNQTSTAVYDGVYQLANKAGATVVPANAPYAFHRLLGDANGDGVVDALDTNLIQTVMTTVPWRYQNASNLTYVNSNMSQTSVNPVAAYNWVGDVNGDGKINALDLNIVIYQKGRRVIYTRKVT